MTLTFNIHQNASLKRTRAAVNRKNNAMNRVQNDAVLPLSSRLLDSSTCAISKTHADYRTQTINDTQVRPMKCPHCEATLPFSALRKSLRQAQACQSCTQSFTLTISISRMFLLLLPVAFSLFMIRPISLHWGIDPTFFSALIVVLYGLSCLTLRKRSL